MNIYNINEQRKVFHLGSPQWIQIYHSQLSSTITFTRSQILLYCGPD